MKYLSLSPTGNSYEEKMMGRKICESVLQDAAEIQYQAKKAKRYRSAFTTGQINYLEKQFKKFPYIGNACRKEVAGVLNIPERAVKIWFQNRRMKEKKEVINKEYNLDRPNNSINNAEFVNDPLYNVHSSQSANDGQWSLQPALSNHVNKINHPNHNFEVKSLDSIIKSEKYIGEKLKCDKPYQLENKNINKLEKQTISKGMSTTANLSNFNCNRVSNNGDFIKHLETNRNEAINQCKVINKNKPKVNYISGDQSMADVPNNIFRNVCYQDLPEDLSARNNSNVTFQQKHPETLNLSSAFIPVCNTQNLVTPCISAGNVMWNPINVMPIIPSPSSSSLPIAVTDNEVKSKCNCNCHMKNLFNHEQGKTAVTFQPQYVIAIPINKNMN